MEANKVKLYVLSLSDWESLTNLCLFNSIRDVVKARRELLNDLEKIKQKFNILYNRNPVKYDRYNKSTMVIIDKLLRIYGESRLLKILLKKDQYNSPIQDYIEGEYTLKGIKSRICVDKLDVWD